MSLIVPPAVVERVLWIRVCPSFWWEVFSGLVISFFWNSAWCSGPMCCCAWQSQIFEKIFLPKNGENCPTNEQKIEFFKFIGKFSHQSFLNLVYNESLYCLLYSCTSLRFGKNLVPEIWVKVLLANQIIQNF